MDVILLVVSYLLIFYLGILFLSVRKKFNYELNQKDKQIKILSDKMAQLKKKMKQKERRRAFRLQLHLHCEFKILKMGNKDPGAIKDRAVTGVIRDISVSGLRLDSEIDLPVKEMMEISMAFHMEDQPFAMKGLIVRKENDIIKRNITYGIKFIETKLRTQNELQKLIRAKEREERKRKLFNEGVVKL